MSRDRDEEDRARWAAQDRKKAEALASWLAGRTDKGIPTKPPLEHATIKHVDMINDAFGGNDVGGELVAPDGMTIHFKAMFGRKPNGWETDWACVANIDVRMRLAGDPRWQWDNWTRATLTDAERARLEALLVATFAERRSARTLSQRSAPQKSPARTPPWTHGPLERPGSPHRDPSDSEYWSREAVQERADDKALLREGRDRYGDDWYPGKYVN